jgi:hypothetical protein
MCCSPQRDLYIPFAVVGAQHLAALLQLLEVSLKTAAHTGCVISDHSKWAMHSTTVLVSGPAVPAAVASFDLKGLAATGVHAADAGFNCRSMRLIGSYCSVQSLTSAGVRQVLVSHHQGSALWQP